MYNPFSLLNKTILVTGASSGIGRAIAIECSKLGATIIAIGRNEERLKDVMSHIQTKDSLSYKVELTAYDEVNGIIAELPQLDGVVNSAGVGSTLLYQFATTEKVRQMFEVNFFAPVELTRILLRKKKINKNGSIVFLSSIDGPINSHVGNSIYSSTKAAIAGVCKGLAVEVAPKGIRVNYLMPGQTETPLIRNGSITEEQLAEDKKKYLFGRYARPEEIAYGAIYLLSDASTFTTGAGLVIDGGFTLQ